MRAITAIAGRVHKGDSGGPVIDTHGRVEGTIFAAKKGSPSGYAVPTTIVRTDLAKAGGRVRVDRGMRVPSGSGSSSTTLSGWRNGATT